MNRVIVGLGRFESALSHSRVVLEASTSVRQTGAESVANEPFVVSSEIVDCRKRPPGLLKAAAP